MNDRLLTEFPRPNVAVDLVFLVALPLPPDERRLSLGVVVQRRADGVAVLPGRFVRERHTIEQTVSELLVEKLGFRGGRRRLRLTMLDVYDDPDRDERGWVVSLGYTAGLSTKDAERLPAGNVEILALHGSADPRKRVTPERLAYDHDAMVTTAVRRTRRRYERSPDPLGLARPPYTLSQLRHVHEAVLDAPLKRDTFGRRMLAFLEPAVDSRGEKLYTSESVGRPAALYVPRLTSGHDPEAGPFPLPRSGH